MCFSSKHAETVIDAYILSQVKIRVSESMKGHNCFRSYCCNILSLSVGCFCYTHFVLHQNQLINIL